MNNKTTISNLEIKQLINTDTDILNTITTWMYNWWGKDEDIVLMELNVLWSIVCKKINCLKLMDYF